jgi:hypothetical protein
MANLLSPGVYVSEFDLTTIVPTVGTTDGAYAGTFAWGPANSVMLISNEVSLVNTFRNPSNNNYIDFFTCANFLQYGQNLKVVRVMGADGRNAVSNTTDVIANNDLQILNRDDYEYNYGAIANATSNSTVTFSRQAQFAAKYPGVIGNSLKVSMCANTVAYSGVMSLKANVGAGNAHVIFTDNPTADPNRVLNVGDFITLTGNVINLQTGLTTSALGSVTAKVLAITSENVRIDAASTANITNATVTATWEYAGNFDDAPGTSEVGEDLGAVNDELHIIVVDEDGLFTGRKNRVLERFSFLSKARDAKLRNGQSNYYVDVINRRSQFIWITSHPTVSGNWGATLANTTFTDAATRNYTSSLNGGQDSIATAANRLSAYSRHFSNKEEIDVSLVLTGESDEALIEGIKTDVLDARADCLAFISPPENLAVFNQGKEALDIVNYRNTLTSSNRLVMDSAWKYQFDKYNNVYRWIPMNGDIAGLCVATDLSRDPWYSPAGFNRGQIKNAIKISWNPTQGERDTLYKKGINPIVNFPSEGVILYGDKTLQSRPSAFDRINVRRLFDVLEKTIATASKYSLFEFNDQFTRAQFVALVEPYLRDVQGRRGIFDFRVVCDETNNTPEVIDRNEFVGDIYIKPARSINFIQLNFVAVRTGVNFDEIVGKF